MALYSLPALEVSFEFFPPDTVEKEETLWRAIKKLEPLAPRFVSVTYGAGGGTRERTHATVRRILTETSLTPAAHLTCVGATRSQVDAVAGAYWDAGVRHIVALRGDPPAGAGGFVPHARGYASAVDLVAGLRALHDFEISVAAYPEVHPEARSAEADLDNLKRKIDAGAGAAITQFFFDDGLFLRFRDRAAAAGIGVPVIPGIMPVTNFRRILVFAGDCGVSVPQAMHRAFEGLDDEPDTRRLVAAAVVTEQCRRLVAEGVREFHFYTLNRAALTYALCHVLGKRPVGAAP